MSDDPEPALQDAEMLRRTPSVQPLARGERRALLQRAFVNWRLPAYGGSAAYRLRSLFPSLFEALMNLRVEVRSRAGPRMIARLRDLNGPAEVFGMDEYDFSVIDWPGIRTVVDLGAHVGDFTLWVADRAPCRILAVEPNPDTYDLLAANVSRAGLDHQVVLRRCAIAGRAGERFLQTPLDSAASSLAAGPGGPGVPVEALTLSELLSGSGFETTIDLLKMDIEGSEYEVLTDMAEDVLQRVGTAIIECHQLKNHGPEELGRRLHAAGFQVAALDKPLGQSLLLAWR